jgi:large subunit ribosomal protein L20
MRVKGGTVRRRHHNQLLKKTKGYRMTKGRLIKVSKEAALHAGQYAYAGRKAKKRNFRRLWIVRLNAFLSQEGYKYSRFINQLKKNNITIDRKILADLAVRKPEDLRYICQTVFDQPK